MYKRDRKVGDQTGAFSAEAANEDTAPSRAKKQRQISSNNSVDDAICESQSGTGQSGSVATSSGVGGGFKSVVTAMSDSAGGHQGKAVLRQHGGPSSHSKSSLGGNLVAKVPDEPLPDPTICEVKLGKETTIEVNKDKLGLGLSIFGGSDTLLGPIMIYEVYPDGAAARDKRLKPGDQILEVNGESFRNITHSRALAVLRQTPAKVRMMVYRDETSPKDDDMLDKFSNKLFSKNSKDNQEI